MHWPQHPPVKEGAHYHMKFPHLFAALRKKREFERLQMPFVHSLLDFDVIIEIGFAQEQKRVITPKQLFLLQLGSVSTVRRRLAKLTEQGIVARRSEEPTSEL